MLICEKFHFFLSVRLQSSSKGPGGGEAVKSCGEARTIVAALASLNGDDFPGFSSQSVFRIIQRYPS